MKKYLLLLMFACLSVGIKAQLGVRYDPKIQSTGNLQYWRPKGDLFVGDSMPYFKDGKFSFYWLLDSAHHASLGGLGGHQWALSTTTDLKTWKQEPVVLGIDESWEKSICTGSMAYYKGIYYAFYATRLLDKNGKVNEQLSYATSKDGIKFDKQKPNPFYTSAPGYSKRDFRDPKVFIDEKTGEFHLFVSSWQENSVLQHAGGALVHLTSKNLKDWTVLDPVLTGQSSVPECPDYFLWKGWYYLIYGDNGDTYYVKSKSPYGPWQEPTYQAINESWANVVKTASFKDDRRIAAAWIPSRDQNRDDGGERFGGNAIFREVLQEADGTLSTKFPAEMLPAVTDEIPLNIKADLNFLISSSNDFRVKAPNGMGALHAENLPANYRITMEIEPMGSVDEYGLNLRSRERSDGGYRLNFSPNSQTVSLGNTMIRAVKGLEKTIKVDIIVKDDIIDVSIDNKRCIVNRTPEQKGNFLWFYAKHGEVKFKTVKVYKYAAGL
ncbi:MAG TPA: family 43 glycosylhydrolase [Pedobacter sp.]